MEAPRELSRSCWMRGAVSLVSVFCCVPRPRSRGVCGWLRPSPALHSPACKGSDLSSKGSIWGMAPTWAMRQRLYLEAQSIPQPQPTQVMSCSQCDWQHCLLGVQILHCSHTVWSPECLHKTQCRKLSALTVAPQGLQPHCWQGSSSAVSAISPTQPCWADSYCPASTLLSAGSPSSSGY